VRFAPEDLRPVRAWDFASSIKITNDPDWTVGLLMGRHPVTQMLYVLDAIRKRLTPVERERLVGSTAIMDGEEVFIRIPRDPGGAGDFEAHYFAELLQGFSLSTENGSKERRADPFAAQCEQGLVKLVEGHWNRAFVDELCSFRWAPMMTRLILPLPLSALSCAGAPALQSRLDRRGRAGVQAPPQTLSTVFWVPCFTTASLSTITTSADSRLRHLAKWLGCGSLLLGR
jgi:predicted phage terminase large subunit-like protein